MYSLWALDAELARRLEPGDLRDWAPVLCIPLGGTS
jgi:hypothetical protein